jgi:hypothetical protein
MILSQRGLNHPLPSILYPQLLGLSMGINSETLGLKMNKIPISGIEELLTKETELAEQKEIAEQKETKEKAESKKE